MHRSAKAAMVSEGCEKLLGASPEGECPQTVRLDGSRPRVRADPTAALPRLHKQSLPPQALYIAVLVLVRYISCGISSPSRPFHGRAGELIPQEKGCTSLKRKAL